MLKLLMYNDHPIEQAGRPRFYSSISVLEHASRFDDGLIMLLYFRPMPLSKCRSFQSDGTICRLCRVCPPCN